MEAREWHAVLRLYLRFWVRKVVQKENLSVRKQICIPSRCDQKYQVFKNLWVSEGRQQYGIHTYRLSSSDNLFLN
jgi:hypothetical protein